jgi:plastocyanin
VRLLLLAAAAAAALALASPALADETIAFVPGGFSPNSVTVRAGERVIFRNDDRVPRRALGDHDRFSSPLLRPGESYVHRFEDRGTFGFRDSRNARLRGAVVVAPAIETITISASPSRVKAGGGIVTLSGRVSNGKAGQPVFVLRRFPGEGGFNISDQLKTGRGGRWFVEVEAIVGARFRAQWGTRPLSRVIRIGGR